MKKNGYLNGRSNLKPSCDHCGLAVTPEGHDGCIGTLSGGVMNACCGHGITDHAYVQFDHPDYKQDPNKCRISGQQAIEYILKNRDTKSTTEKL